MLRTRPDKGWRGTRFYIRGKLSFCQLINGLLTIKRDKDEKTIATTAMKAFKK